MYIIASFPNPVSSLGSQFGWSQHASLVSSDLERLPIFFVFCDIDLLEL